jgi:predicted nucleic acid-binding protein
VARARRRRRALARVTDLLVLDADGVSKAASNDRIVQAWLERARELDADLVISAVTLAELVRGRPRDAAVNRVIKAAEVMAADEQLARTAGRLLGSAGSDATIDALVGATALAAQVRHDAARCVLLTSDPADLGTLLAGHPEVHVLAV